MSTSLVTGGSAGLGAEFARQLAARGDDVVLVARSRERLERLADELRSRHGVHVEVLVADLSAPADVDRVARRVASRDQPIDLLVNNAGLGQGRAFVRNDLAAELAALDVMVRAVMILSHAAALAMTSRGNGAILNVSSVATWLGNGSYSAHKAWVTSFTEGLAGELRGTGVTATAVLPGLTRTEFHDRASITSYDDAPEGSWLSADFVVRKALGATERAKVLVTPSARYAMLAWMARIAPRSWTRAFSRGNR
jgi:short-subunit dehydrogenase